MTSPRRFAVVAPCHAFDPAKLERGMNVARGLGVELDLWPDLLRPERHFAADRATQLRALREALTSPDHDGVWIVRGGSGMGRLLADLDPAALRPRWVVGFSDVSSLFAHLGPHPGWTLVHGPVLHSLPSTDAASVDALGERLRGGGARWVGEEWVPGRAVGPVAGGNLTVLASTCGTPWAFQGCGRVVFLEDVGEAPYRIERTLQQLLDAGAFEGVVAVGVGTHEGCAPPAGSDSTVRDVYAAVLAPLGVPVVGGLPFGHGAQNHPFLWGERAAIDGGVVVLGPA